MPKITGLFDPLAEIVEALEPFRNSKVSFIPTGRAARLLDCSHQTLFNYQRRGILKFTKIGNVDGILVKDLLDAMEERIPPTRPSSRKAKRKAA